MRKGKRTVIRVHSSKGEIPDEGADEADERAEDAEGDGDCVLRDYFVLVNDRMDVYEQEEYVWQL